MYKRAALLLALAIALCSVTALDVQQCDDDHPFENLDKMVSISECEEPPCYLRRKHIIHVALKFKTDREVKDLISDVKGIKFGIPLPFIGYDGVSACNHIYQADDPKKRAHCPLKAKTEYVYKNAFKIEELYPEWKLDVYWALRANKHILTCFTVPAEITK